MSRAAMPLSGIRARIAAGFESWGRLMVRKRWSVIALVGVGTGALAAFLPRLSIDNSLEAFLHEDDPTLRRYNEFRDQFGRDQSLVIALETQAVFDLAFLEKLSALHRDLEHQVPYLAEITSLVNARWTRGDGDRLLVSGLLEEWPEDQPALAALEERVFSNPLYLNRLISEDAHFTTLTLRPNTYSSLAELDPLSDPDKTRAVPQGQAAEPRYITLEELAVLVKKVRQVMARHQTPGLRMYLAGGPVLEERLNDRLAFDFKLLTLLAFLVNLAVLVILFRRASGVVLPMLVVQLSVLATMGIMGILAIPVSAVTVMLPVFLAVVGIGDSMHILVIFFQRLALGSDRSDAIAWAMGHSGLAVVMTSLTTAGGLASFAGARITPISQLGIIAPIGVMIALLYSMLLLPGLLAVVPLREMRPHERTTDSLLARLLTRLGEASTRRPWLVVGLSAGLLVCAGVGIARLQLSEDRLRWLPERDPVRIATELIDRQLKGALTLEAVLDTGRENGLYDPELLRRLSDFQAANSALTRGEFFIGNTVSLVDIVKETHQALNENRPEFYAIPNDRQLIAQELLLFENSGSNDLERLVDSQFSKARLSMAVPWLDAIQYPTFIHEVHERLQELLQDRVQITLTGLSDVFGRAASNLVITMARSFVLAFILITPLMIFMLGSVRRGLLCMLPNLAPVLLTLGLMGWLGVPIDISTLLLGAVILGLAVDDTIHFMHRFDRYCEESGDPLRAVRETLHTTGTAMLSTSLILCGGFLTYLVAYMSNITTFGLLGAFATAVAFLADVTLAPTLMILMTRPSDRIPRDR